MASDPSVSEVATATIGNGSSKRLLDSGYESEKKMEDTENPSSNDSTTDVGLDVENPAKRMKVEAVDGEATAEKNPLNPVDDTNDSTNDSTNDRTNDSTSTSIEPQPPPPPSQPTNCKDEQDKGDNGAAHDVGSVDVAAPADIGSTMDVDMGVAASSQRGETTTTSESSTPAPSPAPSPAITRSRCNSIDKKRIKKGGDAVPAEAGSSAAKGEPKARWRVHQMAEDYTNLVGSMMYPATQFEPYGYNPEQRQYPMEKISLLGFIKSPLRRPTIIEKWSPYEIALFEGSILHYGKEFRIISKQIGTKTTREVIDFYYIWKKTEHYKKWKERYISDEDLIEDFYIPLKKPKR